MTPLYALLLTGTHILAAFGGAGLLLAVQRALASYRIRQREPLPVDRHAPVEVVRIRFAGGA